MSSNGATERTPLLRSASGRSENRAADDSAIDDVDVRASEEVGIGALEPEFPDLGKRRSYSHSHWLAPEDDAGGNQESERLVKFQENGVLEGISRTRFWFTFGGIIMSYFIAMFDSTLMASSHPVITSYFNASNSASWLSTAFLLTSTSLQPLFGRVSDTIGRRSIFLFGIILLAATTGWCAGAQSIGSFIVARAFCGFAAAAVLSMGGIMTNDMVSIEVRGIYQSYINLLYGGGSASGAAFGGFLCDKIGWRMTFAIQIPPLLVLFVVAFFSTPKDLGPQLMKTSGQGIVDALRGFDIAGSVLLTGSVAFLILGLNLGGNVFPWSHPLVITSLVVAALAGAALIRVEMRAARPVMPLAFLSSRPRGNLVFNNCLAQVGINTIIFNAPLYFQAVELESASTSGFRLAGPSVALTICGVSAGFIMTATGRMKELIVSGSMCMLIGSILLSNMWEGIPKWVATIFLVPASIGQGLSFPATSLAVLATSTQEDQAVVTSTLILFRSLGIVMGVSFSSLILQNCLAAYLDKFVTGKHKDEIILRVRKSVHAIRDLNPKHQSQVIDAYGRSLRIVFISAIAVFVIVNMLVLWVKLPNIKKRKKDKPQSQGESTGDASS
ncbi:major facilitator superfamily domain-containing protein [Lophiotrema nucula]|uniref:Major facilitator superfamily domain-containing protein n=1 Tax=Lophiotrema nucula TaxID=690887 RepID=A0A6A5ZQ73_9PLEO|nr:major facilitator superfamily domain-containing protein [Lophiotrema nucula]